MKDIQIFKRLKQIYKKLQLNQNILFTAAYKCDNTKGNFTSISIIIPSIDNLLRQDINYRKVLYDDTNNMIIMDMYHFIQDYDMNVIDFRYVVKNKNYKIEIEKIIENKNNIAIIKDVLRDIVKKSVVEEINIEPYHKLEIYPDQYPNVFITSDTHFGHKNILRFEQDRWKLCDITYNTAITNYIKQNNIDDIDAEWEIIKSEVLSQQIKVHDKQLIENWNKVVGKDDLVYILGDFSLASSKETEDILKQLNGDKVLIRGNHDMYLDKSEFNKGLFKQIYDYKEIRYKGQEVCLMHYPIQSFKHQERVSKNSVLLFGHIHSNKCLMPKHSYNVGVDINEYRPVKLQDAIEKANMNIGGWINGK